MSSINDMVDVHLVPSVEADADDVEIALRRMSAPPMPMHGKTVAMKMVGKLPQPGSPVYMLSSTEVTACAPNTGYVQMLGFVVGWGRARGMVKVRVL